NPVVEYPFADELQSACECCATIGRAKLEDWWRRRLVPKPEDATATVTFVAIDGRTYAVTAWHVIDIFSTAASSEGVDPEGYFLPVEPGIFIGPPFIRPPKPWTAPRPDIALRPIDAKLIARLGKKAFDLTAQPDPAFPVPYALAVGHPTFSKTVHPEPQGARLAMQCVREVAEGVGFHAESDQAQFLSEIEEQPTTESLSGLSGGPVFWSDGNSSGLLGFIKQAMDLRPKEGEETLYT